MWRLITEKQIKLLRISFLEQVALDWTRAARVSTDKSLPAAWRNAVDAG